MARIKYFVYGSPIGDISIASTDVGICRAALNPSREEFLRELEEASGKDPTYEPESFKPLARRLEDYFAGERVDFEVSLDFLWGTEFQKSVWTSLSKVPYGWLTTYERIASEVGRPRAFRAVGKAVGKNPVFLIVPCHRVIRSDGSLGGFGYGIDVKMKLLEIEGSLDFVRCDSGKASSVFRC